MRQVIVLYDDSRRPNQEIKSITGKKSYGNTIFKRVSLRDRAKNKFLGNELVCDFVDLDSFNVQDISVSPDSVSVFKLYSNYEMLDMDKVGILLEKSLYAKECYCIKCDSDIAAIIYPDINFFLMEAVKDVEESYEDIDSDAFIDLSKVNNFRTFITSGFEARFFNALEGDEYTVIKSSDNIDKLRMEYKYFTLLPPEMKQWYGTVYDYKECDDKASYVMERYHMTDLALRYVHGAICEEEFRAIMEKLFHFIAIRKTKAVSKEEYENNARALYIDKVNERVSKLKEMSQFTRIEELIKLGSSYNGIDEIVNKYLEKYEEITSKKQFINVLAVGHGDLCFSNILYNHDASLLRLIDPKGAMCEDELYMNPYYDIAKLSHSICGAYDFFNSDQYEISMSDKLNFKLNIDADNEKYVSIFREYLEKNHIDIRLIRLYEASLFLSMLPLHIDREKKVFGFILNAIRILEEL